MTYIIQNKRFKDRMRPELTLGIDSTVKFQFVDEAGDPIPLGMTDVFTVAVDSNFIHTDSLMAYSSNVTVADADNGIIEAIIPCNTTGFEAKLNGRARIQAWIEVARYEAGSADAEVLLQDTCSAYNRVQYNESEPQPDDPLYYTAAQVDALLSYKAIALAACSGMGEILEENAFTMTWIDPDNVTLNGAVLAEWNQTVLVRKVGSYPVDHTDGTILAATSRALGNKNAYRSTGYTDSDRTEGTTYYYKLFSQTTAGVWNNQDGNEFTETTDLSWGMVQHFVRAGRGPELFPVGTVFEVNHPEYSDTNGHSLLFRVVGHDQVPAADESLTHTMCLDMTHVLINANYDYNELQYAITADETAQAGKTYYRYSDGSYTEVEAQVGQQIPESEWYEKNLAIWASNGSTDPQNNNAVQWLNSTGAANGWFAPQTIFDTCQPSLAARNGFCRFIDPEFLAVVQPAKLTTSTYTTEWRTIIYASQKFWILSHTQVTGDVHEYTGVRENEQLRYYADGNSPYKNDILGTSRSSITRTVTGQNRNLLRNITTNSNFLRVVPNHSNIYMSTACIIA